MSKDWTEDFEHENGMYQNICKICNSKFMGHKIRRVCKECYTQQQGQVQPVVKPVYGHKRTAKQFFIEQYQEGKCEDITTNPYPEFNNNFYLNIYKLMEDYSKSV